MLSIIIPAMNEAGWIGPCLDVLIASDDPGVAVEIIVAANGCTDATAAEARARTAAAAARGWRLAVHEMPAAGKPAALDAGDAAAGGALRLYLDADVAVSPPLLARLAVALAAVPAAYATGRPEVAPAASAVTRAYARIWTRLPFFRSAAPGFGLFAVNAAGRARWGAFPRVISDDTYVRLLFRPEERIEVAATYRWPMVEGFAALVRVRRRQDAGVAEIARRFPGLLANEAKPRPAAGVLARLALADPAGAAAYAAVAVAVRFGRSSGWARGR
ncbi:MAG: glycosyltransferase [Rhodobacteraceae bacterium]|jgi:glycosyltransferase involved in cell wall biosynthesis|nr:glycosyltransferase [Paracoccaceae bacterium]